LDRRGDPPRRSRGLPQFQNLASSSFSPAGSTSWAPLIWSAEAQPPSSMESLG
jgi:hypothetical protein